MEMAEDLLLRDDTRSLDDTTMNDLSTSVYPFLKKGTYSKKIDMKSVLIEKSHNKKNFFGTVSTKSIERSPLRLDIS